MKHQNPQYFRHGLPVVHLATVMCACEPSISGNERKSAHQVSLRRLGPGVNSTKFNTGRLHSEVQSLTF